MKDIDPALYSTSIPSQVEDTRSLREVLLSADRDLAEAFILSEGVKDLLGFKEPKKIEVAWPADMSAQTYDIAKKASAVLQNLQFIAKRSGLEV